MSLENAVIKTGPSFSSIMQILLIEKQLTKKTNPETQKPWEIPYARCLLLADDGSVITVGRLKIPRALENMVKVGIFHADFSLVVPDYGDDKGDIVSQLTGLRPVAATSLKKPSPVAVIG
jgi:hypothetical protein